ncbi:glycosyltransferase family 2 protein [Oscillospiraceae bacterium HV4-5-C5C]|nr:glycosyltransferase family 2 protein [Oscillospiraceae bacterium HV4-5-C5C]
MKVLSAIVPCYNSAAYMSHCIDTLLSGGDDMEILIINDGSSDQTALIADAYAQQYPHIIRAIHQENAGHGGAINTGISQARGRYLKVVDSDDWVSPDALRTILRELASLIKQEPEIDLLISNYVYEKVGVKRHVIQYANALPEKRILSWDQVGNFRIGQYILMHSVIYRTELLRSCGLKLPEHTFYVDNLFVYDPLPSVRSLYYLNVDLYHYYIGRADQSVQERTMIRRIDQQLKVNRMMLEQVNLDQVENPHLRRYMLNYLEIITTVSSTLLIISGTPEDLAKMKSLWSFIRLQDPRLYRKMRFGVLGQAIHLPGRAGRHLVRLVYKISRKTVGFN